MPLLWNPEPKDDDEEEGVGALVFVVLTLVMWGVIVVYQIVR